MFDLQTYLDNVMAAQRTKAMKTSQQLTLGELILKLETIEDKSKPVIFDSVYHPSDIDSWRGSYEELALTYRKEGDTLSVSAFLSILKEHVGATVYGYKGGKFLVGKTTPVWVANYGESHGFIDDTQAVVDVTQDEQSVILVTQAIEY